MRETNEEGDQKRSDQLKCPPLVRKQSSRKTFRDPNKEKPKPAYVNTMVELNSNYDTTLETSYFNQIYPSHSYIGEGSFGLVFKGRNKFDQRTYAIKKLKSTTSTRERYAEINNNEKVGKHPNLVEYFMAWEEANELYMVIEACQVSLADYARKNVVKEPLLWDSLHDTCKALEYLHDKSLIHLDVKPSNIMIHGITFKLADFGTLIDMNLPLDREKSIISEGDAKYLAQEVLSGVYTPSCDIFGLGLSILELVCHIELPGSGPAWHELRQRKYPPELNERASDPLRVIIKRMTTFRYPTRPTAKEILQFSSMKEVVKRFEDGLRNIYTTENLDDINDGLGTEKLTCQNSTENKENVSEYLNLPSCSQHSEMTGQKEDGSLHVNTTPESNFELLSFIHQDSMLERSKSSTCHIVPKVLFSGEESNAESEDCWTSSSANPAHFTASNEILAVELDDEENKQRAFHSTPISKCRLNKMCLTFEEDSNQDDDI